MRDYIISEDLANEILQYLSDKPYKEVVLLIQKLQTIKPNIQVNDTESNIN
jgi:hypothetical protein